MTLPPQKKMEETENLAKERLEDRSTVVRELLEGAIRKSKVDEAVQLYKENKATLSGAALVAQLSVGEMMEELVRKGVKSNMTLEDYKESLATAFKLFGIQKET